MRNVVFENVVFEDPGFVPFGNEYFYCEGVQGVVERNSTPVPPCFRNEGA